MKHLILASQSPRRQQLLHLIAPEFTILVPNVEERIPNGLSVSEAVEYLSLLKAKSVLEKTPDNSVVISADTLVSVDGIILEKPENETHAYQMLSTLSGRSHQVHTGITVLSREKIKTCSVVTEVYFRHLSHEEITEYIMSGEPFDKAGGYGIQGKAAIFTEKINGDFYNVVGLPICRLNELLKEF